MPRYRRDAEENNVRIAYSRSDVAVRACVCRNTVHMSLSFVSTELGFFCPLIWGFTRTPGRAYLRPTSLLIGGPVCCFAFSVTFVCLFGVCLLPVVLSLN